MVIMKASKTEFRRSLPKRSGSWQEKLSALDLNSLNKSRTCEVFFLVEYHPSCSVAIEKFKNGAKLDPTNSLKSVDLEDIMKNIEKFTHDDTTSTKIENILYRNVAQKVTSYLNNNEEIPCELLASLIKLQIISVINKDVVVAQKKVLWEHNLENECAAFVQSTEPPGKDKKGKGKKEDTKGKDKGKGAKKGEEKIYDVCDSNNELKPKPTSKLVADTKVESVAHETMQVDPKHLFIVIVGFYDFNIIEELFKIGVPITGIVELTKLTMVKPGEVFDDLKEIENDSSETLSDIQDTQESEILQNFWNKTYEHLEGNDECPLYLNNTIHMTVNLPDGSFDESNHDDKHCLNVFSEIGSEIIKSPDIQRQHVNYVRNLKICPVGPTPTKARLSQFELYNKIMNVVPPDCSNICTIVYALIEEVRQRVPDPPQIILDTPPPSSVTEFGTTDQDSVKNSFLKIDSKMYHGIKGEIAKILNKNLKSHSFESGGEEPICDPKMNIKISDQAFLVQANNDIEIMVNSYGKLKPKLLDINFEKLIISNKSVLLWKGYPYIEEEQQKILSKIYRLQAVADTLDLPIHELQYIIHTILFNSFNCESVKKKEMAQHSCSLQLIFPQRSSTTTPNVIKQHIPYKPIVETLETSEESFHIEIPYVQYLDNPNLYEAKNLATYKWYESLSVLVTVQELFKAEQNYLCLDYKYCTFDDSILLRYHNDVDKFGINTINWDQSLRTPITSIREFCKYIIHFESKWIEEQEEKYIEELEKELERAIKEDHKIRQNFYPDLIFTDKDFIQSGSIKGRMIEDLRKPIDIEPDKKGGKKDKDKDKAAGKAKDTKKDKGKDKTEKKGPPSQIAALEKLSKTKVLPVRRKLSLRCASDEEPFSFYAYDVSNSRVQLTGSTTVFHSQDGFKVTVDQTRFIAKPKRLSLNICINDHSLILHYNQATILEPFTFHLALSDRSIIAFAKPLQIPPPDEILGEKICQALKRKKNEKRQEIYFVSETQRSLLKCFNIPYITRRNLVLSEDLIIPFLNQMSIRGINVQLAQTENLTWSEVETFEEALGSGSNFGSRKSPSRSASQNETMDLGVSPKYYYDVISKKPDSENISKVEVGEEEQAAEEERMRTRRSLSGSSFDTTPVRRSNKKLLKKIRKAVESQLPIFKICSSRLHKHQYVKRIKSRIEIPVGTILKRIPCKTSLYKPKVNLKISKLLPVKPCEPKHNPTSYDVRISLPSGLTIQSIEGIEGSAFNIRQRYLDKGPQCKNIAHEYSRMFTRDGNIIIKKYDGNVDVLGAGGQKVRCEIPYVKVRPACEPKGKECPKRRANHLIPLHTTSLTKFQKHLNRSINRLSKHLIDGYKSQHLISHRACQRWKKNHIKEPKQVYILQTSVGNFKKFSLITSDGKQLKITPSVISEEKIYYTSTATDYRYQEIYHGREDGTQSIINHESLLVTQFPDGTRLTTWIDIERDMLFLEEREEIIEDNTGNKEQQVYEVDLANTIDVPETNSEEDTVERFSTMTFESETNPEEQSIQSKKSQDSEKSIVDEGWVSVHLNVKYEHPNYATIIYYGKDNHSEIILPNKVKMTASSKGEYVTNIDDNICTVLTTEEILLESRLCNACFQKSTNKLNIKPLYYKSHLDPHQTELLRTTDTFNKVFIVNYAGQCFRNLKYQHGRINCARCKKHSNFEHQKLFILTRSLMGCKLWDLNSYRERMTEAKRSKSNVHEGEALIEIRNYVNKPYHEKFLIPYHVPTLVLSKNKPKQYPPKELAYITRQVIHNLPEIGKYYQIYSILLDLCAKKGANISETVFSEFSEFLNHVVDEILGKHKRASSEVKKELSVVVEPKLEEPIPFYVRYQKWLKECAKYWKDIREQSVPKFFNSKYLLLASGISPEELEGSTNSSSETICDCSKNTDISRPCQCGKIDSINPEEFFTETLLTTHMHESDTTDEIQSEVTEKLHSSFQEPSSESFPVPSLSLQPVSKKDSKSSSAKKVSSIFSSGPVSTKDSKPSSVSQINSNSGVSLPPGKTDTWWCKTDLGMKLLTESGTRITTIAIEMVGDTSEEVSVEKVESAARQLMTDLMMAVENYDETCTEDYVTISVNTAVGKILHMQLSPIELVLLVDNVERERFTEEMQNLCSPMLAPSVVEETSSGLSPNFEPCKVPLSKMEENPESSTKDDFRSYFGVYGYYWNIEDVLKPKYAEEQAQLKIVFEKCQNQVENNAPECVQGDGTDITCKSDVSDVPCHTDDKPLFTKYHEECDKCTEFTKPTQTDPVSKASVKDSQSEVIFSVPSVEGNIAAGLPSLNSQMSSLFTPSDGCMLIKSSNTLLTNIEVTSTSSLLEYCASENLTPVDGSAFILQKSNFVETPSKLVVFSVASLREKEMEKPVAGPYVQRNPYEAADEIEHIVANTKRKVEVQEFSSDKQTYDNAPHPPGKQTSDPLLDEASLHKCRRCIMQIEDELGNTESLSRFKTKSVASLLSALKRAESDDNLSSTQKEKISASLLNIVKNLAVKPQPKRITGRLVSKISDKDVEIVKGIRPGGSRTLMTPSRIPRQEVTRRTVGSQTQKKVDSINQTSR